MIDQLEQAHTEAKGQYSQVKSRIEMLDHARKGLQKLRDLGDLVDQDDVVGVAADLVGRGFTPQALAGLLADMPTNPQGMATWVEQLWGTMSQREAQLMPLLAKARFGMGTAALQLLAGHHIAQASQPPPNGLGTPQGSPAEANSMSPQPDSMSTPNG